MVDQFKDKLYIFEIAKIPAKKDKIVYKNFTKEAFDKMINKSIDSLKPDFAYVIRKTFIESNKFWWWGLYSKTSYYNKRKIALDGFFAVFETIECLKVFN